MSAAPTFPLTNRSEPFLGPTLSADNDDDGAPADDDTIKTATLLMVVMLLLQKVMAIWQACMSLGHLIHQMKQIEKMLSFFKQNQNSGNITHVINNFTLLISCVLLLSLNMLRVILYDHHIVVCRKLRFENLTGRLCYTFFLSVKLMDILAWRQICHKSEADDCSLSGLFPKCPSQHVWPLTKPDSSRTRNRGTGRALAVPLSFMVRHHCMRMGCSPAVHTALSVACLAAPVGDLAVVR